jgi:hypothetical protein
VTEQNETPNETHAKGAQPGHSVQVGVRLRPVDHSEQPIFSNLTVVQGAPEWCSSISGSSSRRP